MPLPLLQWQKFLFMVTLAPLVLMQFPSSVMTRLPMAVGLLVLGRTFTTRTVSGRFIPLSPWNGARLPAVFALSL